MVWPSDSGFNLLDFDICDQRLSRLEFWYPAAGRHKYFVGHVSAPVYIGCRAYSFNSDDDCQ